MYNASRTLLEAKIVILGSQGVGKTSLAVRYISRTFAPNSTSTIGASFMAKKLTIDHNRVSLQIWDTAGQERFRAMAPMYYRGAQAALLVYDITSRESFDELVSWIDELRRNMTEELVIVVVANKKDLPPEQHEVQKKDAQEFVERYLGPEANLYHVSAKEDDGQIEEIFVEIARKLVERLQNYPPRRQLTHTHLEEEPATTQSSCCGF